MVRQAITDQITYYNPFNDGTELAAKDDRDFFESVIGKRLFGNDPAIVPHRDSGGDVLLVRFRVQGDSVFIFLYFLI